MSSGKRRFLEERGLDGGSDVGQAPSFHEALFSRSSVFSNEC